MHIIIDNKNNYTGDDNHVMNISNKDSNGNNNNAYDGNSNNSANMIMLSQR